MVGETTLNLIRDVNGYPTQGLPFSIRNDFFVLTQDVVTEVTVPSGEADSYIIYITVASSQDVWVLPAHLPLLTLPNGTVTSTLAQLINTNFSIRIVEPGQILQFLSHGVDVAISINYYENVTN